MKKFEYRARMLAIAREELEESKRRTVALEGIATVLAGIRRDTMDIATNTKDSE